MFENNIHCTAVISAQHIRRETEGYLEKKAENTNGPFDVEQTFRGFLIELPDVDDMNPDQLSTIPEDLQIIFRELYREGITDLLLEDGAPECQGLPTYKEERSGSMFLPRALRWLLV